MNEQRLQAYANLIKTLLNRPSREKSQILNANRDLIDAGLVLTMAQAAEILAHRTNENASKFLIKLACQIADELKLSSSPSSSASLPTLGSQLAFFAQIFQVTEQSNSNPEVVYPLLKANLNLLGDYFAALWKSWLMVMISDTQLEQAHSTASVISNFCVLINEFPLGSRANNLEIAIAGYELVAQVFTRDDFPMKWANTQNNLGTAYSERIQGEKAENLEIAIRYFLAAFDIKICETDAEKLAGTQNNIGIAYRRRIRGEKAESLEEAIRYFKAALEVRTPDDFPKEWARTQYNLGSAYQERVRGKKAENLETAIHCYLNALKVFTRKEFPQYWADTQNELGNAYIERIQGKKPDNLEAALGYYSAALEVHTREDFPERWAAAQGNLANAYLYYIWGNRTEHLEAAIRCCKAALQEYTRKAFPERWALLQNNLGNAYLYRVREDKPKNLQTAIRHYLAALCVRTRKDFPQDYAITQYNLGLAYQETGHFGNAYNVFAAAIEIIESLRTEITFGSGLEIDKQKLAEEWNKLYQGMVEVCLELGNTIRAIEYAERSKTRNLVELILTRDIHTIFPPEVVTQLEQLRDEIASGQYELQNARAENPTTLAQHLQQLRQQRNELQDSYLPIGYGFNFEKFRETLDDHTAIIQWYITDTGFETFIITRHSLQRLILPTPANDLKALVDWAKEYLDAYTQAKKTNQAITKWIDTLASRLSRLAEILHLEEILKLVPDTCSRLILIPHRYLHLFPLHALPLAKGDFLCDRFPNGVGYAPSCQLLQVAQNREQHRHHFSRLLAIENPTRSALSPLAGTKLQLEQICQHFDSDNSIILREQEATEAVFLKEQMRSPHCVHFCCHGSFNFGSPLKSALHLADPDNKLGADADLTLGKIFEKLNLEQCRLVTFSACETGIADPTSISDEYISLVSGFLYAGSPSVVSTLWAVQQAATNLFMIEFYKNLKHLLPLKPGSVAIALNKTQKWLRTLTGEDLGKIVESPEFQRHLEDETNKLFKELLERAKLKPYPFEKPYYWAAFVATGL